MLPFQSLFRFAGVRPARLIFGKETAEAALQQAAEQQKQPEGNGLDELKTKLDAKTDENTKLEKVLQNAAPEDQHAALDSLLSAESQNKGVGEILVILLKGLYQAFKGFEGFNPASDSFGERFYGDKAAEHYENGLQKNELDQIKNAVEKSPPGERLAHDVARAKLEAAGFEVKATSGVVDASKRAGTTSLQDIFGRTVDGIIALKNASGVGGLRITGGTENGHANGTISHASGLKVDINHDPQILAFIEKQNPKVARTNIGNLYTFSSGGYNYRVIDEGNHFDVAVLPSSAGSTDVPAVATAPATEKPKT